MPGGIDLNYFDKVVFASSSYFPSSHLLSFLPFSYFFSSHSTILSQSGNQSKFLFLLLQTNWDLLDYFPFGWFIFLLCFADYMYNQMTIQRTGHWKAKWNKFVKSKTNRHVVGWGVQKWSIVHLNDLWMAAVSAALLLEIVLKLANMFLLCNKFLYKEHSEWQKSLMVVLYCSWMEL